MTRISADYYYQLVDKHLNKERIELLRIPNAIKSGKAKINLKKIPKSFRLGTGHVTFFYDKILFLKKHYENLTNEAIKRGFNPTDFSDAFDGIPDYLMNDYEFTEEDRFIVRERIIDRLKTMKNLKYYRDSITVDEAIELINK